VYNEAMKRNEIIPNDEENRYDYVVRDEHYYVALKFGNSYVVLYGRRGVQNVTMTKTWDDNYAFDFSGMKVLGRVVTDEPSPSIERLCYLVTQGGKPIEPMPVLDSVVKALTG
jgi:hypothetical protein